MAESDSLCSKCSAPLAAGRTVRLWDGHNYCAECVHRASPALLTYAREHDAFEDSIPYDRKATLLRCARLYGLVGIGLGILFSLFRFSSHGWSGAPGGMAAGFVLAGLVGLIQIPGYLWMARKFAPTVRISDGVVEVSRPAVRAGTLPLERCRWFMGKTSKDSHLWSGLSPVAPAVVLVYPLRLWCILPRSLKIATGSSPEMREILTAFLTLAGVPRRR